MANQLGFYINQEDCIGCFTCQIACKDKNDLEVGEIWRQVKEFSEGSWVKEGDTIKANVWAYWLPMACNHCDNPKCVTNCPTGAIYKREEDGIVLVDADKCIGCRYCSWSCPYGAPQFSEKTGKIGKCNLCVDLIEKGGTPACVAACPMRALEVGPIDELRQKYGTVSQIKGMPAPDITNPNLVIKPHRDAGL